MKLFRRILVPYDFSEPSGQALRLAADLARAHGGRLLVLHVITPFHPTTALPQEGLAWRSETELIAADLVAGERRHLEALIARTLTGPSAPPVTCRVELGDPFLRIAEAAQDADSIVLATAGRTGLSHLLIGSVAEKVVRHSPVPVLTLRTPSKRARRKRSRPGKRTARHR